MSNMKIETKKIILVDDKRISDSVYDDVICLKETVVGIKSKEGYCIIEIYDIRSKSIVLSCMYKAIKHVTYAEYVIFKVDEDNYYIYFDSTKKIIGPFSCYEVLKEYNNSIRVFKIINNVKKIGLYDKTGIEIVPCEYDYLKATLKNYTIVEKDGNSGFYFYDGEHHIGPVYANLPSDIKDTKTLAIFNSYGKMGIITSSNIKILPAIFDDVTINKQLSIVQLNIKGNYLWYSVELREFAE